jgi:hypothetical protein
MAIFEFGSDRKKEYNRKRKQRKKKQKESQKKISQELLGAMLFTAGSKLETKNEESE